MTLSAKEDIVLEGASAADIAWFESFGWNEKAVPPVRAQTLDDYRRREALLNHSIASLSYAERGASPAGHLAAAIGAQIANFEDEPEEE